MQRALAALAVLACLPPAAASASDAAALEYLGFSPDGAYFAFEEYGMQDGSGFNYSNVYVIDTRTDAWVPGTPVRRISGDGEELDLEEVRALANAAAEPILSRLGIEPAGNLVVDNPETEVSADRHHVRFMPLRLAPPSEHHTFALGIETIPLAPAASCPDDLGYDYAGFRLTIAGPDGAQTVMHEDRQVPSSRACPFDYAISAVLTYFPDDGAPVLAVMVGIDQVGFEGPDRRYLAVTGPLDWQW